jgi:hypothetical protein
MPRDPDTLSTDFTVAAKSDDEMKRLSRGHYHETTEKLYADLAEARSDIEKIMEGKEDGSQTYVLQRGCVYRMQHVC